MFLVGDKRGFKSARIVIGGKTHHPLLVAKSRFFIFSIRLANGARLRSRTRARVCANQHRRRHKCDMAQKGDQFSMQALLTVDQLAACLRKSVASIRSDATRNPRSLPPVCRLPGTKRLLWRVEDVENWLGEHVSAVVVAAKAELTPGASRRGRPTKSEQLARQRRQNKSSVQVPLARAVR